MTERPVPPLVPPEPPSRRVPRLAVAPAAPGGEHFELLLAMAKVDHSGRVGDRVVLGALGWQPGDRHDVRMIRHGAELYRSPAGRFHVDSRGNVFLPAATRALLSIQGRDRVVLVACAGAGTLRVHPVVVATALLAEFYQHPAGGPDVR